MKSVYPCKIIAEKVGGYSVIFPDFGGATQGDTLYDALFMADDFANFAACSLIEDGEELPTPTPLAEVEVAAGEIVQLVRVDTEEYRKKNSQSEKALGAA